MGGLHVQASKNSSHNPDHTFAAFVHLDRVCTCSLIVRHRNCATLLLRNVMEMTLFERLRKFITQDGAIVEVRNNTGTPRRIRDAEPDTCQLVESAEEFRVEGKWHKRADFEKLMDKRMKPGNARQIA